LNSLPAFGGKRPDEAWLAQQLQQRLEQAAAVTSQEQHTSSTAAIVEVVLKAAVQVLELQQDNRWVAQQLQQAVTASAAAILRQEGYQSSATLLQQLMLPVTEVVGKLMLQQQQQRTAAASTAATVAPAGTLLLQSVCASLTTVYSSRMSSVRQLQPLTAELLACLLQHPDIGRPASLQALLCTAAEAEAATGKLSLFETATQQAQQLQLTTADVAAVTLAALTGAAKAAAQGPRNNSSAGLLLHVWQAVAAEAAAAGDESQSHDVLSPAATAAVTASMTTNAAVGERLLGAAAMPVPLLVQLLQAAVSSGNQAAAVQQLLAHAEQHQLLQQLPPNLLIAALRQAPSSSKAAARAGAAAAGGLAQQAVAVLLQQEQAPDVAAAAALLPGEAAAEDQWQQLLAWLQQQCSAAPAAAACSLLCDLLLASVDRQSAEQSWQLYQLLQQCQEAGSWPAAHQGLPAAVCSALIEQQAADSNNRVLLLWQAASVHQQLGTNDKKISRAALKAVLSALVSSEQHAAALQLVQQQDSALLQHLAKLWQQQVPGPNVLVRALQQLCESGSDNTLVGAAAADVAVVLLSLLEQQEALQQAVHGQAAVQLVQLLSQHHRLTAALQLTSCMLSSFQAGEVEEAVVAGAVAAVAEAAAAAQNHEAQQWRWQQVVELLQQQPADAEQRQAVLLAALDPLLASKQAAAVALLLSALQPGAEEQLPLPALLEPMQLQQLVDLCCKAPSSTAISTSSSSVTALPSPLQLAQQCVTSSTTAAAAAPSEVTVSLLNALAKQHPELQPSAAAAVLGLASAEDLESAGADSVVGSSAAQRAELLQASKLIAQLCYVRLLQHGNAEAEALRDAVSVWVDKLSREAAAAALFSTWYWSQQDSATAATAATAGQFADKVAAMDASYVGALGLQLYRTARVGKPSLGSLLLDLALAAAAAAADWEQGGRHVLSVFQLWYTGCTDLRLALLL
jgi:hypothetical protein